MVSWDEYKALRQQHVGGIQVLQDITGILQGIMPGGTLSDTLKKFMPKPMSLHKSQPDVGANSYQEATPDSHSWPSPHQEGRPRSLSRRKILMLRPKEMKTYK